MRVMARVQCGAKARADGTNKEVEPTGQTRLQPKPPEEDAAAAAAFLGAGDDSKPKRDILLLVLNAYHIEWEYRLTA